VRLSLPGLEAELSHGGTLYVTVNLRWPLAAICGVLGHRPRYVQGGTWADPSRWYCARCGRTVDDLATVTARLNGRGNHPAGRNLETRRE
jgi:hypothetical protein